MKHLLTCLLYIAVTMKHVVPKNIIKRSENGRSHAVFIESHQKCVKMSNSHWTGVIFFSLPLVRISPELDFWDRCDSINPNTDC